MGDDMFMGLAEKYAKSSAPVHILPVYYEKYFPFDDIEEEPAQLIIGSSKDLDHYDEEFDNQACYDGIFTAEPLSMRKLPPQEACEFLAEQIKARKAKFTITLGGDQSLGIAYLKTTTKPFSTLHFSTHPNLLPSFEGEKFTEKSFGYHALNEGEKLVQVGIRGMQIDEKNIIEEEDNILVLRPHGVAAIQGGIAKMLSGLTDDVFIELDVSVFDPSFMRNTMNPMPNGLNWQQVIDMLTAVFVKRNIVGVHISGFYPQENFDAESFAIAELVYKIISMRKVAQDK